MSIAPAPLRDMVALGVKLMMSVFEGEEAPITLEDVVRLTFADGRAAC